MHLGPFLPLRQPGGHCAAIPPGGNRAPTTQSPQNVSPSSQEVGQKPDSMSHPGFTLSQPVHDSHIPTEGCGCPSAPPRQRWTAWRQKGGKQETPLPLSPPRLRNQRRGSAHTVQSQVRSFALSPLAPRPWNARNPMLGAGNKMQSFPPTGVAQDCRKGWGPPGRRGRETGGKAKGWVINPSCFRSSPQAGLLSIRSQPSSSSIA